MNDRDFEKIPFFMRNFFFGGSCFYLAQSQYLNLAQKDKKKLMLDHISPRYKKNKDVENEARMEFGNVVVPKDLEEIEI